MSNKNSQTDSISQSLQAPGKGLPTLELWFARALVGWRARFSSRQTTERLFADEKARIYGIVDSLTSDQAAQRVLIPRLIGMEDSSRYWSVYMTLDHLRIVNRGATGLIASLARGQLPSRIVGTADVKPSTAVDQTVVADFDGTCAEFERTVAAIANLNSDTRWPHPWFGPLNAARWHFVIAFHMSLHRRQIERIKENLSRSTDQIERSGINL